MNPACECPIAGFCKRHQIQKGDRSHKYCQGVGDNAWKYWQAWEQGKLGATAPESPMLDRSQFGDGDPPDDLSTIGTALEAIFVRVTGLKIECPDCQRAILRLNSMTPDQVEADRVAIVADIKGRIPEQAPVIWKALAFVDDVLHLGQTEARLNDWLSEAIITGGECPRSKKKEPNDRQSDHQPVLWLGLSLADDHTRDGDQRQMGHGSNLGHSSRQSGI